MSTTSSDEGTLKGFKLQVLVPEASTFDAAAYFNGRDSAAQNVQSLLSAVSTRRILHFDELINVYLILQTPLLEKPSPKSVLDRWTIALEVVAIGANPHSDGSQETQHQSTRPENRDVIWSGSVDTGNEPVVLGENRNTEEGTSSTYFLWRISVFLSRPRIRLQSPLLTFKPSATLRSDASSTISSYGDRYLPSGIPDSLNLLESLKDEPGLHGVQPRLPALRLSRISTTSSDLVASDQTIHAATQPTFRAIPAITARVRYSKANIVAGKSTIIASLDIETGAYLDNDISIRTVNMRLGEGSAEDLGKGHAPSLPLTCGARDNPTFLFRLTPHDTLAEGARYNSNSRSLDISIDATVLVSVVCQPRIEMRWRTGVDFSTALNPTFGAPNQSLQRRKRPANIAMNQAISGEIATPRVGGVSSDSDTLGRERAAFLKDLGISITFTAPDVIYVGEPFSWDIFVVNRSSKARKFALVPIPKRRRGDIKAHLSRPSSSSTGGRKEIRMADAVTDESLLFAMQRNATQEAVQLVSLSNDITIGPLHPGSCFNTDLRLLPLAPGCLKMEAVRIIDVATNEAIDVHDLPDIMAYERAMTSEDSPSDH